MMAFFKPSVMLINRLKYPQKLMLMCAIVIFIVLSLGFQLFEASLDSIKFSQMELLGIEFNDPLSTVLKKAQEYRYLENLYLSGKEEYRDELAKKKNEIDNAIEIVDQKEEKLGKVLNAGDHWDQIKTSWETVKSKIQQSDFDKDTTLITNIQHLMVTVCDASNLTLDPDIDTYYLMDTYCSQLPHLGEEVSLIRDLGIKALINKSLPASDREQVIILKSIIDKNRIKSVAENLEKVIHRDPQLEEIFHTLKLTILNQTNGAVELINKTLMKDDFNFSLGEFIDQFNTLFETTYSLQEETSTVLSKLLNLRVDKFQKALYLNMAGIAISLLIFIYLFIGIYLSIIRSIMHLVKGSEQIARGDLDVPVKLETQDELSQIASSFNIMREKLSNVLGNLHLVVSNAKEGKLDNYIEVTNQEGFYKALYSEINQASVAFNDVIVDITTVLDYISKGDLTHKVTNDYHGSFGELKIYVNKSVQSLDRLVRDIKSAIAAINHAAQEIALGNNDLAKRTDQEAASLEETSESMEKLTITVKENTQHAKGLNDLAKIASSVALNGGEVVNQVAEMMAKINISVHQVADISSVIDGIAFQTNILALNAAVEAARAGEQGRGFSVVASEIRNLAQRSSVSAKEIKTLINSTVEGIENGTKLAVEAGQTMNEVVNAVNNVSDIISQIAKASVEQSDGIEQINIAINQIDLVTQQNSALVEEAARASAALEQQTKHVDEMMDVFKITSKPKSSTEERTNQPVLKPSLPHKPKHPPSPPKRQNDEWTEF